MTPNDVVQARLVSLFAGEALGIGVEGAQRRLQDLVQVVPDLGATQDRSFPFWSYTRSMKKPRSLKASVCRPCM